MRKVIREQHLPGTTSPVQQEYEKAHAAVARRAAADGMVLLENREGILPLAKGDHVALYGAGASKTVKGGTGSGDVNERYHVSIAEGMRKAGFVISNEDWLADYDRIYEASREAWKQEILEKAAKGDAEGLGFFDVYSSVPFSMPVGSGVTKTDAETAIYVLSRVAGEGADRQAAEGDYYLNCDERQMLEDVCTLYPNVIVLVNAGGVVDLSFMDVYPSIKALLVISQPGMEGGNAVADVLSGEVNPGGKLTDTWAFHYEDYPNSGTFSHNNGNVQKEYYQEGIYVGYRYFDSFGIPVRYGFGEGLSYTSFEIRTDAPAALADGCVEVPVVVRNTGNCSGREVVQAYVSLPEGALEKEYRRLCAFAKTRCLLPGEEQKILLTFGPDELSSYDESRAAWVLEPGSYLIFVGDSLKNAGESAVLRLEREKITALTEHICPLREELTELSCPRRRESAVLSAALPVCEWDLSALETRVTDYSGKGETLDYADEESVQIAESLGTEKLVRLVTGDPAKGQGSNLGSAGVSVPGSAGETSACALEDGVANIVLADGPAGLRLNSFYYAQDGLAKLLPFQASLEQGFLYDGEFPDGEKYYQYCTAIPVGTLLAQTWDTELIGEVGKIIGDEMNYFGVTLWLAPGMNIHRNPLCGRNFEYYSEDPLVSGRMAAAMTKGVQSVPGCGTTIKHFACNNQEDNRMGSDSVISERALREIYLRGFGIAIREAKPLSVMTSYNLINGIHSANSYDLCTKVARGEFGFDGVIMTDWTTTEKGPDCTAAGCMRAGNDLVMPGQFSDHESIRKALRDGTLEEGRLRSCVAHLIHVILQSDRYEVLSE